MGWDGVKLCEYFLNTCIEEHIFHEFFCLKALSTKFRTKGIIGFKTMNTNTRKGCVLNEHLETRN